jgi:hypothetical protein
MRSRMRESKRKPPTVLLAVVVVFLFVGMLFMLYPRIRGPIIPNICPIDGQLAEWSKRQGRSDCEYGHFSTVEKKPHTWVAACP